MNHIQIFVYIQKLFLMESIFNMINLILYCDKLYFYLKSQILNVPSSDPVYIHFPSFSKPKPVTFDVWPSKLVIYFFFITKCKQKKVFFKYELGWDYLLLLHTFLHLDFLLLLYVVYLGLLLNSWFAGCGFLCKFRCLIFLFSTYRFTWT